MIVGIKLTQSMKSIPQLARIMPELTRAADVMRRSSRNGSTHTPFPSLPSQKLTKVNLKKQKLNLLFKQEIITKCRKFGKRIA